MAVKTRKMTTATNHIMFSCDDKIAKYIAVLITSIAENNPGRQFVFHVLHKEISETNLLLIMRVATGYSHQVRIRNVSSTHCKVFSKVNNFKAWPVECFFWLVAHFYMPQEVERVLYLDVDTLCHGSLSELFAMDFEGKMLIAPTGGNPARRLERLDFLEICKKGQNAFNSGVLLLN